MRRFLKKLRKGLKTACLAAALTTCWGVGQTARANSIPPPDYGDEVTIQVTGTISPVTNDLTHVFFIYGTGYSGLGYGPWAIKLGDFPSGQSTDFSVQGTAIYHYSLWWYTAGLYGDISSGQYIEGVNGVNLGIDATEGTQWNWKFFIDEETVFTNLLNDTPQNIYSNLVFEAWHFQYMPDLDFTGSSFLFDFSNAAQNGQTDINIKVVPEPITLVLFGGGWLLVVASRRQKQ